MGTPNLFIWAYKLPVDSPWSERYIWPCLKVHPNIVHHRDDCEQQSTFDLLIDWIFYFVIILVLGMLEGGRTLSP